VDDETLTEDDFSTIESIMEKTNAIACLENFLESIGCKQFTNFLTDVSNYKNLDDPVEFSNQGQLLTEKYFGESSVSSKIAVPDDIIRHMRELSKLLVFSSESFNLAQNSVITTLQNVYLPLFHKSKLYEITLSSIRTRSNSSIGYSSNSTHSIARVESSP